MENLNLPVSDEFPAIDFNALTGHLSIKGMFKSYSGLNDRFFEPLMNWLKEYALSPLEQTTMELHLDYFGTEVSKLLLWLFKELDLIFRTGHQVSIYWLYEENNIDIFEVGEEYKSILSLPFNLIMIDKKKMI